MLAAHSIDQDEERYKAIAEQLRKDREAGKVSAEEAQRKQEAARKEVRLHCNTET